MGATPSPVCDKAIAIAEKLAREHLDVPQYREDLANADFSEALRLAPGTPESHAGLGFASAHQGALDDAAMEASAALLSGSDNYLILHNVACIYGRLSASATESQIKNENLALAALERAVELWRKHSAGPDEQALIRHETASPDSLQARPEFQRLLSGPASN